MINPFIEIKVINLGDSENSTDVKVNINFISSYQIWDADDGIIYIGISDGGGYWSKLSYNILDNIIKSYFKKK